MDPIADMLTIIRNAQAVHKETVRIPFSRIKMNIAELLEREGYIAGIEKKERKSAVSYISLKLKYTDQKEGAIRGIRRMSKPGQRIYVGHKEIRPVKGGIGKAVLSTPQGLMVESEARKKGVGGEYLLEIW
ncbi:MAG: 30S ribosomal protein S8 [Candidatus Spechtbacterales bacterium]